MLENVVNACHFFMIVDNLGNQDCLDEIAQVCEGTVAGIKFI